MKKINLKNKSFFRKFFIKFIRKFGFEIIDQNSLSIVSSEKKINENLSVLNKKNISLPLGEVKIIRPIKNLLIIFRSFTNENSLLSQNKKRLFEKEKKEYSLRSLNSITENIVNLKKEFKNFDVNLVIVDDNSDKNILNQFNDICSNKNIAYSVKNLDIKKYVSKMKFNNNDRMIAHNSHIYESKNIAINSDYDLIYFVEDDYIHDHDALIEMVYTYQKLSSQLNEEIVLCPADYPYLYINSEFTNNLIGHRKHWRNVNQSLCTYLISNKTLKKFWSYYEDMFLNNYDPYEKPLHDLYEKIKCFSPMPSLSLHLTNINSIYGLSPLKDWISIWEKNKL